MWNWTWSYWLIHACIGRVFGGHLLCVVVSVLYGGAVAEWSVCARPHHDTAHATTSERIRPALPVMHGSSVGTWFLGCVTLVLGRACVITVVCLLDWPFSNESKRAKLYDEVMLAPVVVDYCDGFEAFLFDLGPWNMSTSSDCSSSISGYRGFEICKTPTMKLRWK